MKKSVHTLLHKIFIKHLVDIRKRANLSQRDLAARLDREHSLIARIELGERRIDVIEFFWICQVCECDPVKEYTTLMEQFQQLPQSEQTPVPGRK